MIRWFFYAGHQIVSWWYGVSLPDRNLEPSNDNKKPTPAETDT